MGLLSRLRGRLAPPPPAGIGPRFTPAMEETWRELEEQVDAELKKAGSAMVGAWEVGAAELGRVVVGWPDDKAVVERFSDALVPTLQPFQDLHKGCPSAMAAGLRAGLETGSLAAAARPLQGLMAGLDEKAAEGWGKTTKHLEPLIARCANPEDARTRFAAGERSLRQACVDADAVWRARLDALPQAKGLWEGITGAAEAWQLAMTREIEIVVVRQAKGLVGQLRG